MPGPRRPARPFFLPAGDGERYCLFHPPQEEKQARGSILYVHPFAEEMNKSRRMAALQAKRFSQLGYGVLQIDLFGCGDSTGDMRDASWETWQQDLDLGASWLRQWMDAPLHVWGLRLGAMLALDFARRQTAEVERFILWQPVISGEAFLSQFLRMKLANAIISGSGAPGPGVRELRETLRAGMPLEVAGYELPPALAGAIDALRLEDIRCGSPVDWFEIVQEPGRPLPPASRRVLDTWTASGIDCRLHLAAGPSFWISQEIGECPELIDKTCSTLSETCP
ncbi:hydrolase 2, exosortase A system-associated [Noviherbaspirillum sp. 17J57-3]|uniref:Hydrolase 2, exosortase A system-associated n=2 Tax=Noviherbaspirillum galbum TaxID=2709383 RepID=A0A6B3STM2_9BURK|nr:hydrolase 2, exosortase A system-associated [Noviherbaspirillum galbum]